MLLLAMAAGYAVAVPAGQHAATTSRRAVGVTERDVRQRGGPGRQVRPTLQNAEAGDYYLLDGGQKVSLMRAAGEVCVRYAGMQAPEEGRAALQKAFGPTLARVAAVRSSAQGTVEIVTPVTRGAALDAKAVARASAVAWAFPVFVDAASKSRMIPTDEIVVQLPDGVGPEALLPTFRDARVTLARKLAAQRLNVFVVRLLEPKNDDPLSVARALAASGKVRWANPNFMREMKRQFTPNDTLFAMQQTLRNTGQNGAVANADVNAPEAWNVTTGATSMVIAIVDEGVDVNHADLRIYRNPGESGGGKETNGIDDDGNGYVDDWRGWDFTHADNDPSPISSDAHGTACAGVAGAIIGNASRVAGVAGGCQILPLKVAEGDSFQTDDVIATAIAYAADHADVISCSWGGGSPTAVLGAGLRDAAVNGRGGKGCPVFCATGNSASKWNNGGSRISASLAGYSGTCFLGFCFGRGSLNSGENTVRIDDVCLLDSDGYTHKTNILANQNFESSTFPPTGWTLHSDVGTAAWVRQTTNAKTGTGGSYSVRAPSMSAGSYSADLLTPALVLQGNETLAFDYYESAGSDSAFFVDVFDSATNYVDSVVGWHCLDPAVDTTVIFPASDTNVIAVGASTDCDRRSDYSEYGTGLELVAPSNGGWNDVPALDPIGTNGWSNSDVMMDFGGTSAATPLAAGIGALVLSVKPSLPVADVRRILRRSCDKIGGVTYSGGEAGAGGRNAYYGYGRINAQKAVQYALISTPVLSSNALSIAEGKTAGFSVRLAAQPSANVTVTTVWTDGETNLAVRSGASLTFTPANWNVFQTVLLADSENADLTNGVAHFACSAFGCSPMTVTATEEDDDFVLTVNTNGYGTATGDGVKDRDNAPFAITATPGAGYVFAGWSGPDAAKVAVTNAASTTIDTLLDATVTANFRLLLSVCTVTFDAQGGAVSPTGAIVTNGLPYGPLPTPAFAGYTFSGWYTNALVTDAEILSNTVVTATANHTLYAKWTPLVTARGTPYLWLDQHRLVAGGNYEAADTSDSDGDGMTAWQEYVAGTVPTNGASVLRAVLSQKDGQMSVHWAPDLTDAVPVRMYSVYGAASLQNGIPSSPFTNIAAGTPVPLQSLSSNRFFKVGVRIQ